MKGITDKQKMILDYLDAGMSITKIAQECRLTEASVRAQVGRISRKVQRGHYTPPLTPIEAACQQKRE